MSVRGHALMLAQAIAVWFAFWLLGLPAYYRQYSTEALAVACVLLSVAISLAAIAVLQHGSPSARNARAFWLALYYTVPFAAFDTLYCGFYLGRGASFLWQYWYLTVFYFTPWLTFPPTAALLNRAAFASPARVQNGRT